MTNSQPVPYAAARGAMVAELRRSVRDQRVLGALGRVPRERFVTAPLRERAYENTPLPIGYGQTISQPLVVGIMLEALRLEGSEHVLDIGTGSGYQAALLAELAASVVTVERLAALANSARALLAALCYRNVTVEAAGEELGWPDDAPYDAIVVAAAAPEIPSVLIDQLAPGGRLVLPVGERSRSQELIVVEKSGIGLTVTSQGPCGFVPLIGAGAFPE